MEQKNSSNARRMKTKKKNKLGLILFLIVLIIFAISGFLFAKNLHDLNGNWLAALMGHNKKTLENLGPLEFLILGESTGMSDTIIVCKYDPKTQEASMLSIPRDTFTGSNKSDARISHKINALYSGGKTPKKTLEAVNKITGLNIQKYILVDTKALKKLVDTIGGVKFDVPIDMDYDDETQDLHIHLKAGIQTLDGDKTEQVVRFRHNSDGSTYSYKYGIEDYGRMHTQRDLIIAVAKQTIQMKNITEIGKIMDILKDYVHTNMNFSELKDYIPYAINMNTDNVKTGQLPGESQKLNGTWFFLYDKDETKNLVDELFINTVNSTEENISTENN